MLNRLCNFLNRLAEKIVGPDNPIKDDSEDEEANRQAELDRMDRDYENRVNF
jgi:hypothetical protein